MSEKTYQKYIEYGPDSMTLDETKAALQWRDGNPAEALAIARRSDERARQESERETLRAAWEIQGKDPVTFEANFERLRQDHEAAKFAEMENGARAASLRSAWREF